MVIFAQTPVKEALEAHPELQEVLLELSPRFRLLRNRAVFATVSRWATFADVARMAGLSLCEVLHRVNRALGTEEELFAHAPDCLAEARRGPVAAAARPDWLESARQTVVLDVRHRDDFFLPEILDALRHLASGQVLQVISAFYPAPLIEMLREEGYALFYEEAGPERHHLFVRRPAPPAGPWQERKASFDGTRTS